METVDDKTDFQAFQAFYAERHASSDSEPTLEEAVAEFRKYQSQLKKLRAKIAASEESYRLHGARPLTDEDLEKKFQRLEEQLRQEGVID